MKKSDRVLCCLLLLANLAGAQEGVPLFTQDFTREEFARRRSRVYEAIGANALAVVQGMPKPTGSVGFRQSNEFYYLCGIEVPHAYLLLDGAARRTSLYLLHRNEARERVDGRLFSAEDAAQVMEASGVDAVYGIELLGEHLARLARTADKQALFVPFSPAEGLSTSRDHALRAVGDIASDPWDGRPGREGHFIDLLRSRFPHFEMKNLTPILDGMRLIKSPAEIDMMRKATRLSGLALLEGMRSTRPGMFEYELEAMAKFIFYRNGAQGEAYEAIVASSTNAWFPHYKINKRKMAEGDFLLMDFAPDVGYYMSDVTRMWPVSGKFSAWQTELYDFYIGCYEAILDAIRPNLTAAAIKQEAVKAMDALLAKSKFSRPHYEKAAREFVDSYRAGAMNPNTSLGHWIGMATHDVGLHAGPLQPGMVFTIEPALRVPEEKIYIRLEDVIVITENGKEVLSDFVPRDRMRIEKIMAERGMLEEYEAVRWTGK